MKRIYLDYAATTPLDPRVRRKMEPFWAREFGNPSSIHQEGVLAKKALDAARVAVARVLEAHPDEIVFTSGGTEANNLAIFGVLKSVRYSISQNTKPHVVTTSIEHASVLEPLRKLEQEGKISVTYVPVEKDGRVKVEKILAAVRPSTVLVSVMYANNEIGTIQPIARIGKAIRAIGANRPLFHTDACQAPLYLNCLVNTLGVDLMTLDGHKIYGPKGVGALYVRRGTPLVPQILGGGQERGRRSTTENLSGIGGFAEALHLAVAEREKESARLERLRNQLLSYIRTNVGMSQEIVVNGSLKQKERLPNNLNISLPGSDTEMLSLQLDAAGIACSTKSSCLRDERESSVVKALGGGTTRAQSTLRFTLGRATTEKEIEQVATILSHIVY